jgi:hypothetical protein
LTVLLAVRKDSLFSIFLPIAVTDVLSDAVLINLFPTLNAVCTAGIWQALALSLPNLVGVVGPEDVTGGEIGRVQVKDMCGKPPAQCHKASEFRPGGISNKQTVRAEIKRELCAEFAAPCPNSGYVLEMFIQHIGHHAEHTGEITHLKMIFAAIDLVFKIADHEAAKYIRHDFALKLRLGSN